MNSQITYWCEININPGCNTLGGVFKLCVSFTLASFECKCEVIPDFEGECHDFTCES